MWVDRLGGLAATHELARLGMRRGDLEDALEAGLVIRVRKGWYARSGIDHDLLAAARIGGRATCATALRALGVWVRLDGLHVAVRPNACQLRSPADSRQRLRPSSTARVHWSDVGGHSRLRVEPLDALRDLARCEHPIWLLAAADSLLRRRPDLRRSWPPPGIAGVASADGICESGTETWFWAAMRSRVPCRRQVLIAGVGRVDFVIGERLVVEIDGAEYHTDPRAFEQDRRRDALLSALGFRVLRFSYRQVVTDWPSVEASVLAAVARLDHL